MIACTGGEKRPTRTHPLCFYLQHELIAFRQKEKRKWSGMVQRNPDRPPSSRKTSKEDSVTLIGSGQTNSATDNDSQFGE